MRFRNCIVPIHTVKLLTTLMETTVHLYVLLIVRQERKGSLRRSFWTLKWVLLHPFLGHYKQLIHELMRKDPASFRNFLCLDVATFWEMVDRNRRIVCHGTFWRKSLCHALFLAITRIYLATENSYKSLSYDFRVGHNTVSLIIPVTCCSIYLENQS